MAAAQVISVRLTRADSSTPWGFRLQGGKDFGTPLLIQKVNMGSIAERVGLQVGDAVVRVNGHDVYDVRHKDAQDAIVRAGNSVEITLQRGGHSTWKPSVTPVGFSTPSPNSCISPSPPLVTKTSLEATNRKPSPTIGSYNCVSKPYSPQQMNGGGANSVSAIVNKQYNSPVGIYSDESIAETLSAQAEVLAGGVLGVNFKKNEKNYDSKRSEVFKMVQEVEKEPKSPEPDYGGEENGAPSAIRHVSAPQAKPSGAANPSNLHPGQNICCECERLIVGVFVRIKDKNLHVECFKCATCGTSLKNVGYFNISNKLYCDIHAKMIARQNPAGPNMQPVTALPSSSCAFSSKEGRALASPSSVAPTPPQHFGPTPFHTPRPVASHVAAPTPLSPNVSSAASSQNGLKSPNCNNSYSCTFSTPKAGQFMTPKSKPFYQHHKGGLAEGGGGGGNSRSGSSVGYTAPRRGRGILNPQNSTPGARIPLCAQCNSQIRGPFVTAVGKIWCPEHFVCVNQRCRRSLVDIGFVEEPSGLYCEYCFEQYLAPTCSKCCKKIKGDCLNAIGKHFHPECFTCAYCGKLFGNTPFFLEDGLPYCENDWNELFTTKCFACGFPIEAGDRWVEALNNNYHSPCFNCTICKTNLEGQSFYAKGGRPFCKNHAK